MIKRIGTKLRNKLSNRFIQNLSWMGLAEIIPRIFRLGVTVILARYLTRYDYGLAAIIVAVGEFTRIFTNLGIGTKIVQADEKDLKALCNSAYWLNWVVFVSLFFIQCIVAFPIAWFYHDSRLILPICVGGITYLTAPICAIQGNLIIRENRLKICAINNASQVSISYILSAVFAFLGLGVWSFVLPWLIANPLSVYIYYSNHSWRPTQGFTTKYWGSIFDFGKNILGTQLLMTLRNNLDYLLVGRFLGVEELGLYFFGFNAGLGVSLSAISAINSSMYPYFCAARENWLELKHRYFSTLKTISFIIIPLVCLQSSLAPFYVPIVFGHKWITAVPILVLICLSAIPRPFADAASQLLVAIGKPHLELRWNIIFTAIFTGALLVGVHWQAIGVAAAVLLIHVVSIPLFVIWTSRYVFHKSQATARG